jgi:glycosyltransferase involved in cell wall biosynthesis
MCLDSIRNQTYQNIEIIVVDNYSQDDTREIAKKYTKNTLLQNGGMGVQINRGAKECNGKYILFIDDDMYCSRNVINDCMNKIKEGYDALIIHEECLENSFWSKCRNIEKQIYIGDLDAEAARFYKTNVFLAVNGINERLKGMRDYDIHQKVHSAGYKIGRVSNSKIMHDVTSSFSEIMIKRFLRAQTLYEYKKSHSDHYKTIIFRIILIKSFIHIIYQNPLYGLGLFILKFFEYLFSGLGLVYYLLIRSGDG